MKMVFKICLFSRILSCCEKLSKEDNNNDDDDELFSSEECEIDEWFEGWMIGFERRITLNPRSSSFLTKLKLSFL